MVIWRIFYNFTSDSKAHNMIQKSPPDMLSQCDLAFMASLNERDRRHFIATKAEQLKANGVSYRKFSKIMGTSTNTIRKSIKELQSGPDLPSGRIRREGGGRKREVLKHPEWTKAVVEIIEPHTAGLPQDESVVWISLNTKQIMDELKSRGIDISRYLVKQILGSLQLRERSFYKDLPMKDVKDRNEQFEQIALVRKAATDINIPIISADTKKKEMTGIFKRPGKALSKGKLKAFDHDFATFSEGQIVPHGIYDVTKNTGYMTIGTSHDTSKFFCENIERVWNEHLKSQYPEAGTIVILCDGGGSNSSSHKIVKQDLMDLADRLNMRLLVIHYPPYCSKFNPIEHRLFSQITRSWQGAPLMSVEDAAERARRTTTKAGLKVYVHINTDVYETKRKVDRFYSERLKRQVVFAPKLGKWNYLIKPNY